MNSAPSQMKRPSEPLLAQIELVPAAHKDEPILANLLELYIHDFSEFLDCEIGPDGRFGYPHLPLYWREPDRHPFLLRTNGRLAGLVFVKKEPGAANDEAVWDMAEFFIFRGYRRRGIGTAAAHEVWKHFPGRWQVRVMESNTPAQHFWARAISTFLDEAVNPVRLDGGAGFWQVFSFESKPIL